MKVDDQCCWFNINFTDGLGPAAAQKVARYLDIHRLPVTALLDFDAAQVSDEIGLSASVSQALAERLGDPVSPPYATEATLITPSDERFPTRRLIEANPPFAPVLWAQAQLSLLAFDGPTMAVAGSRETSEEIIGLVYELAKSASRQGWMTVSGLAKGVDSAAHQGAITGGTGTIGVLASGISSQSRSWAPDETDEICLISQFMPSEPWSGPRAMQRNATIAGLSDRVVVAAAGTSGGSWEMAQLCLKRNKPLFVLDLPLGEAAGNQRLIKAGAMALSINELDACLAPLDGPLTLFR